MTYLVRRHVRVQRSVRDEARDGLSDVCGVDGVVERVLTVIA